MPILGASSSGAKPAPTVPTSTSAANAGSGRAYNNGSATVSFSAPTTSKLPVTSYTATSSPGSFTATGASSPLTVTGLQSNTQYVFTVTATSAAGTSNPSAASGIVTATTVPQAPTIGTATDGGTGTTVSVPFTANATGGSSITGYTVASSPGGLTGTGGSSPITVSGLTTGTAYTFTVTATNANGTSTASAASNSVTPAAPSSFESIATFTGNGTASTYTFSSIPSGYKSLQIRVNALANGGGRTGVRLNGDSGSNYNYHALYGFNDAVAATNSATTAAYVAGYQIGPSATLPTAIITDIIDYTSTSKNTTIRSFYGVEKNFGTGNSEVGLSSGLWRNTAAVTSITVFCTQNYQSGTSIALYGVK
jgi:hypothetical protein